MSRKRQYIAATETLIRSHFILQCHCRWF